ncbi:Uncharacterised protein [Klebsiella pneumoniae]|uniref:hypothetical protein n=1 Tax=Klebsiella pneumoniae TaxID=573 RepID=UPI000E2CFC77|nr:hypothetical protein [Klebsiella pneumoniae]SYM31880.1 Uncharacterised protein [Klebsiella pneumoniae]VUJ27871.1 Uncharacterised protein [Klebsiella pneumoniae]
MIAELALFFLPLLAMFLIGLGLWALGQWLRRKGYSGQLDKIDAKVSTAQRKTRWLFRPLSGAMVSVGRGLSRVPLFGNRRSRDMWDDLEELSKHQRNNRRD